MKRSVMAIALVSLVACGGGSDGPTGPSSSVGAPTLSTTNTSIFIGQTVQFAATGGGTIRWGGDNSQVATVDQTTGRVTGVGNGRVTIWAENEGGRTTRLLRGLPSFAGTWQGSWVVERCTTSGDFAVIDSCEIVPVGTVAAMGLSLTQADDRISAGGIIFGGISGSTTATTVSDDGQAQMTATMDPIPDNPIRVNVDTMVLRSPAAGVIEGTFEQVWTGVGFIGSMRVTGRATTLTRTSGGPALLAPRAPQNARTLEDLIRLMMRR